MGKYFVKAVDNRGKDTKSIGSKYIPLIHSLRLKGIHTVCYLLFIFFLLRYF